MSSSGRRFEGKNLDEALDNAARGLGIEPFQVAYHIVIQKRGFLGGTKRVVIEAEPRPAGSEPEESTAPVAEPPRPEPGPARTTEEPPARRESRRGNDDEPRRRRRGGRRERSRDGEAVAAEEIPPQAERTASEQRVADWCGEVARLLDLRVETRTAVDGENILVTFFGADSRRLTDRGGEALDAIQVLANKALVGRSVDERVELDAGEFKRRREDELSRKAHDLADRVRREGREHLLPAMSPIERRIVHLALQEDADVETVSRGDGFLKRVAIVPRRETVTQE